MQVIPHVTNVIKDRIRELSDENKYDVVITEIGGTTGDIEGLPFLEAIRQFILEVGAQNVVNMHVTLVPYIKAAHELKTKPTQQSVAKLREIAPAADPATRTYLAKFSLPEADDKVSLGMTATLTLADPATTRVARLPLSALFNQGGDPSLYIVDDQGEVTLKPVKVKSYETNCVVISGGVDEGAKVVALGVQKLDPAQKVRVVSSLSF